MTNNTTENEYLQHWVFVYNPFDQMWNAVPRDIYTQYWNHYKHPRVIRSSKYATLIEILYKTKGDEQEIKKIGKK